MDFAEVGKPCSDQEFLYDHAGLTGYTNFDACGGIDKNLDESGSNEISE